EPITSEGGINVPRARYIAELRRICDKHGWLLMLDEVQTGIGRTGTWFAFQHTDIKPDVITLAKGLGGGVPIGACLAAGEAAKEFAPGKHGSTFGGNPLACRAALATLQIIAEEKLMQNAVAVGEHLRDSLARALAGVPGVREVRGQ